MLQLSPLFHIWDLKSQGLEDELVAEQISFGQDWVLDVVALLVVVGQPFCQYRQKFNLGEFVSCNVTVWPADIHEIESVVQHGYLDDHLNAIITHLDRLLELRWLDQNLNFRRFTAAIRWCTLHFLSDR